MNIDTDNHPVLGKLTEDTSKNYLTEQESNRAEARADGKVSAEAGPRTKVRKARAVKVPDYHAKFRDTRADMLVRAELFGYGKTFAGMDYAVINDPDTLTLEEGTRLWREYGATHGIFDQSAGVFYIANPDALFWETVIADQIKRITPENILLIKGRAGTGKTTVVAAALAGEQGETQQEVWESIPAKFRQKIPDCDAVFPCSPTGVGCENLRGAFKKIRGLSDRVNTPHTRFRMSDDAGKQEGLPKWWEEWTPQTRRNAVYVMNECFFCDLRTMALFLMKVPTGALLILEGDPLQLPPVGWGEPIATLDRAGVFKHVVTMERLHRFEKEAPGLARAVNRVLDGEFPKTSTEGGFKVSVAQDFAQLNESVLNHMASGYQVVTPTNGLASWFGMQHARRRFAQRPSSGRKYDEAMFLNKGDRCRLLCSDRAHGVYNGMLVEYVGYSPARGYHEVFIPTTKTYYKVYVPGKVAHDITSKMEALSFRGENLRRDGWTDADFEAVIDRTQRDACAGLLMHAESVTVHRAQGSEWKRVLVVVPFPVRVLNREWLYVSMTRAKQDCVLMTMEGEGLEQLKSMLVTPCRRKPSKLLGEGLRVELSSLTERAVPQA